MGELVGKWGSYGLTAQIHSKGAMGELWRGVRRSDGLEVSVKWLRRWHPSLPEVYGKLQQNPCDGMPPLLDFFEFADRLVVVRPWITGTDWKTILKTPSLHRQVTPQMWLGAAGQILTCLHHLHSMGIVHRDLKPSNFIFQHAIGEPVSDWNPMAVMVMDPEQACLFPDGSGVRSPFAMIYSPPEMLLQHGYLIDGRTDLFALGITLFHVLAGRPPYEDCNAEVMLNLQLTYPLKRPGRMDEALFAVLAKAAYKEPFKLPPSRLPHSEVELLLTKGMDGRYTSAIQMLEALGSVAIPVGGHKPWYHRFF